MVNQGRATQQTNFGTGMLYCFNQALDHMVHRRGVIGNQEFVKATLVSETRSGVTKILCGSAGTGRTVSPAGGNIALYTAYDSAQVAQAISTGVVQTASPARSLGEEVLVLRTPQGMELAYRTASIGQTSIIIYDLCGRVLATLTTPPQSCGLHHAVLPEFPGIAAIHVRTPGRVLNRLMVNSY